MIGQLMRPSSDQVHIRVDMNKEDMDTFVFCVATKKSALRLAKDMADLVSWVWFLKTAYRNCLLMYQIADTSLRMAYVGSISLIFASSL